MRTNQDSRPGTPTKVSGVDGARLLRVLDELAEYGADARGGVTRLGYSEADNAARGYLSRVAEGAGLVPVVDQAGNLIIRRPQAAPGRRTLLIGSHLDSVTNGGRLDGAYGVVAAIEVLRTLSQHGITTRHEPVAVAFANEEGGLVAVPFIGSLAVVGRLERPAEIADRRGRPLRDLLRATGGNLDRIDDAAWPPGSIGGYLELHIEQGPVLERRGIPIGVVDAIVGRIILDVAVYGAQNHAGTTPMSVRQDALAAAARLVLAIEDIARGRRLCSVSTVGVLEVTPGAVNVVPGLVRMSAEIRDTEPERLARAEAAIHATVDSTRLRTGLRIDVSVAMRERPVRTDPGLRAAITSAAGELGLPHLVMSSGAGHDAQIIATAAPIGMIFVPSAGGVSHAPHEHTDDTQLVAGANVLLQAAMRS